MNTRANKWKFSKNLIGVHNLHYATKDKRKCGERHLKWTSQQNWIQIIDLSVFWHGNIQEERIYAHEYVYNNIMVSAQFLQLSFGMRYLPPTDFGMATHSLALSLYFLKLHSINEYLQCRPFRKCVHLSLYSLPFGKEMWITVGCITQIDYRMTEKLNEPLNPHTIN